jgi:hypothetical protein
LAPVKIRLPKQKRLPHAIADAEVRKLLALTTNPIHRTCFALMYACGLRTGEAVSLEIPAIDGRNHLLTIIGKGNKGRVVLLMHSDPWAPASGALRLFSRLNEPELGVRFLQIVGKTDKREVIANPFKKLNRVSFTVSRTLQYADSDQGPLGMSLEVSLRGVTLRIKRVEVLVRALARPRPVCAQRRPLQRISSRPASCSEWERIPSATSHLHI